MTRTTLVFCLLLFTRMGAAWAQTPFELSNLEGSILTYSEGDPATTITSAIVVASKDPIVRAVIQLTNNYASDQDRLLFSGSDNISSLYDAESGTLTLLSYPAGSSGSAVSFQNALRAVRYQNIDLTTPQAGLRGVTFQVVNERGQTSNVVTRNVSVLTQNDIPELVLSDDSPITYAANSGVNSNVLEGIMIEDEDSETIESASVTIETEGFQDVEDRLTLATPVGGGITATISGNNQTINFNGSASLSAYQDALRSVQFSNDAGLLSATEGNRKISVSVNDGTSPSITLSRFVSVGNTTNVPPTISAVRKATTNDTDVSFILSDFTDQYQDPEGNASFSGIYIRSKPLTGTLLFKGTEVTNSDINAGLYVPNGEFSDLLYRPAPDFVGEAEFLWNASDGTTFAANNVPVLITVTEPALALTLTVPESASTEEDSEVALSPVGVSTTQEVSITVTLTVSNGTLTLPSDVLSYLSFSAGDGSSDPSMVFSGNVTAINYALSGVRYLPNPNYNGSDALSVNASAASSVNEQGTLAITITPSNDPFRLTNIEPEALEYTENDPPLAITNQLTIESLDDGSSLQIASATVTVTEGYVAGEDILRFAPLLNITGSQEGNVLTLTGTSDISSYQTALRTVTYQNVSDDPAPTKTISFTLLDEADSSSNTVTRNVAIQSVEDPLQLTNLERDTLYYVIENDFVTISNTVTVTDPDSPTLDRAIVSITEGYDPALDSLSLEGVDGIDVGWNDNQGELVLSGTNSLTAYTLALRLVNYHSNRTTRDSQPRTISIQAFDGDLASEIVSRPLVLIANDPPELDDFEITVYEGDRYTFTLANFVAHYTDPDNAPQPNRPAEIRITALPENGVLLYQNDTILPMEVEDQPGGYVVPIASLDSGELSYQPATGFVGLDTIGWNAFDGAEAADTAATIAVQVLESLAIALSDSSFVVCSGQSDTLSVTLISGQADVQYVWSCEGTCGFEGGTDQPTVIIAPTQSASYVVSVSSGDQQVTDTVSVIVEECPVEALEIPSGFTPNADGENDQWIVKNTSPTLPLSVEVFDRYGNTVFQSDDYQNDWEGTYEGQALPVGTYYYLITYPEGEPYKGAVNLLR